MWLPRLHLHLFFMHPLAIEDCTWLIIILHFRDGAEVFSGVGLLDGLDSCGCTFALAQFGPCRPLSPAPLMVL